MCVDVSVKGGANVRQKITVNCNEFGFWSCGVSGAIGSSSRRPVSGSGCNNTSGQCQLYARIYANQLTA